jgi:hypothetical protein
LLLFGFGFGVALVLVLVLVEEELGELVDEVEVELEVELDDELEVDVGVAVVEEVGVVVVELESGAQDSFSDTTVPWTGSFRLEIGVLGSTSTLNVYVCPPSTVTVTVHASAEAIGERAVNIATRAVPRTAVKNSSFPLLGNLRRSPIHDQLERSSNPAVGSRVGWEATGWSICLQCRTGPAGAVVHTFMSESHRARRTIPPRRVIPGCACRKTRSLNTKAKVKV